MAKTLIYQLYAPSWRSFKEMSRHLFRIHSLGIDYVWVGPIFPSPWYDHGYDIEDYRDVHRDFGTIEEFDNFVKTAHRFNMRVIIDLTLNHTSTRHCWFTKKPEYYCWSPVDRPGWKNLFNGGPAWRYHEKKDQYYLHLFHEEQADLNWFPSGELNTDLVQEFREIVDFWTKEHHVDGFRLDIPQAINKDFSQRSFGNIDMLDGEQAAEVINAIFPDKNSPFLLMECFDPTFGQIVDYYAKATNVDFIDNVLLKRTIKQGLGALHHGISEFTRNPHFMLELESHDAPRFPSRIDMPIEDIIRLIFSSQAEGICLYQGQELGLKNPTEDELDDDQLMKLDAQTAMRYILGAELGKLRPESRANARISLPLDDYVSQIHDPTSNYNLTKMWIKRWRG